MPTTLQKDAYVIDCPVYNWLLCVSRIKISKENYEWRPRRYNVRQLSIRKWGLKEKLDQKIFNANSNTVFIRW